MKTSAKGLLLGLCATMGVSSLPGCTGEEPGFQGAERINSLKKIDSIESPQSQVAEDNLASIRTQQRQSDDLIAESLADIGEEITALKLKDEELEKQIASVEETLGNRISELEKRVKALEDQDELFKNAIETLRGELDQSGQTLNQRIDTLRAEIDESYAKKADLSKEREKNALEIAKLERTIAAAEQKIKTESERVAALTARIAASEDELQTIKSDLENNYATREALFKNQSDSLLEMEELDRKISAGLKMQAKHEEQILNLSSELQGTNEEINRLESETIKDSIAQLKAELASTYATRDELRKLQIAQSQVRNNLKLLNSEIFGEADFNILQEQDPGFKSRIDKLEEAMKVANRRIAKNESGIAANQALIADLQKARDTYKAQFEEYKGEVQKKMRACKAMLKAADARAFEEIKNLHESMAKMNATIALGEESLAKLTRDTLQKLEKGNSERNEIQLALSQMVSDRQDYESAMNKELEGISQELSRVKEKADAAHSMAVQNSQNLERVGDSLSALTGQVKDVQTQVNTLKDSFTARLSKVESSVEEMLGDRTPAEFAQAFQQTVTEVETVQLKLAAMDKSFEARVMDATGAKFQAMNDRLAAVKTIQDAMRRDLPLVKKVVQDFSSQLAEVKETVVDTIAPFQAQQGSVAFSMEASFKAEVEVHCTSSIEDADFANAFQLDYFSLFSTLYAEALIYGHRSSEEHDIAFHEVQGMTQSTSIFGRSISSMLQVSALGQNSDADEEGSAQCLAKIEEWAKNLLHTAEGSPLQILLSNSETLKAQVRTLATLAQGAQDALKKIETTLAKDMPELIAELQTLVAQHMEDLIKLEARVDLLSERMEEEAQAAKNLRKAQLAMEGNTADAIETGVRNMEEAFDRVKDELNSLHEEFDLFQAKQTGTNSDLYSMIAALAVRVGAEKIAKDARRKSIPGLREDIALPPIEGTVGGLGIHFVGHYYANTTKKKGLGIGCFKNRNKISQDVRWYDKKGCAVNMRRTPLKLKSALLAAGLKARVVYSGVSRLVVSVKLKRDKEFRVSHDYRLRATNEEAVSDKVDFVAGDWVQGIADLDVSETVAGFGTKRKEFRTIKLTAYGADEEFLDEVQWDIKLYSPILLNFAGNAGIPTIQAMNSSVKFDLDGDGIKEKTGWPIVRSSAGFLAIDKNNNGKIDNGSELFGEAFHIESINRRATNGFEALRSFDSNGDGLINSKDKRFGELKVWFDHNLNGQSEASELLTLTEAKVTTLSTEYREVEDESLRAKSVLDNDHRYSAKFWGPKTCGPEGCTAFDIFFSKVEEMASK